MIIKKVELLSNNLSKTAAFYSKTLDFEIAERTDEAISFNAGNSVLTFKQSSDESPIYHFAFDIPHNQLEQSLEWLLQRLDVISFRDSPIIDFPNWNAKSIYFYDNNGNALEFIARFDNQNKSATSFGNKSIVSISEIALVTDNVEKLATQLQQSHGLAYFDRQIQQEDFSVIGDDDGLFILVKSSRKWFPTPVKVQKFPVKVIYEHNTNIAELDYK